jgi:hypothetical protein
VYQLQLVEVQNPPEEVVGVGPKMATRGGSEWELIKILLEGDDFPNKMDSVGYPKSHAPHATFRLPKTM